MNIFTVLAVVALLATVAMLITGIVSMMRGGEEDREASTRYMLKRVEFQGAALALGVAAVLTGIGWLGTSGPGGGDLDVHLGVLPAAELREQYGPDSTEARAFGGIPDEPDAYLVTVSLMESGGGGRVEDADVRATVGRIGLSGTERTLQAEQLNGATTYGEYFRLRQSGRYTVDLSVDRPDSRATDRIRLEFHRP